MGLQTVHHELAPILKPLLCHPEEQMARRKNQETKTGGEVSLQPITSYIF